MSGVRKPVVLPIKELRRGDTEAPPAKDKKTAQVTKATIPRVLKEALTAQPHPKAPYQARPGVAAKRAETELASTLDLSAVQDPQARALLEAWLEAYSDPDFQEGLAEQLKDSKLLPGSKRTA